MLIKTLFILFIGNRSRSVEKKSRDEHRERKRSKDRNRDKEKKSSRRSRSREKKIRSKYVPRFITHFRSIYDFKYFNTTFSSYFHADLKIKRKSGIVIRIKTRKNTRRKMRRRIRRRIKNGIRIKIRIRIRMRRKTRRRIGIVSEANHKNAKKVAGIAADQSKSLHHSKSFDFSLYHLFPPSLTTSIYPELDRRRTKKADHRATKRRNAAIKTVVGHAIVVESPYHQNATAEDEHHRIQQVDDMIVPMTILNWRNAMPGRYSACSCHSAFGLVTWKSSFRALVKCATYG